jgi:hypothetical protein
LNYLGVSRIGLHLKFTGLPPFHFGSGGPRFPLQVLAVKRRGCGLFASIANAESAAKGILFPLTNLFFLLPPKMNSFG